MRCTKLSLFSILYNTVKAKVPIYFECNMTLNCLANDWKKDEYRYSLELSKSKTPQNTILVVGVNPGGQTDPEEQYFGSTIRRVCKLVINNGEGNTTYDSVLFVNLTPVIAKAPSSLKDTASIEHLHKDNINNW